MNRIKEVFMRFYGNFILFEVFLLGLVYGLGFIIIRLVSFSRIGFINLIFRWFFSSFFVRDG